MHPNTLQVEKALREHGADVTIREFPQGTRTAAEAAVAVGAGVGQIAKSVVFVDGDEGLVVVASGAHRVDTDKLATLLGRAVQPADADAVRRLTGYPIGGVPPLAHATPMRVLVDHELMQYGEIWAAAGTPQAVFAIAPAELLRVCGAELADVAEVR